MKFKSYFWSLVFAGSLLFSSLVAFSYGDNMMEDELSYAELDSFKNSMFGDVPLDHENYEAIYFLKNYDPGIIEGYTMEDSDVREYKPDNEINRAEFLKLILEGTDKSIDASYESCFPDVAENQWYTKYICYAKEEGMINGYPDGTFKPDQTINEVEAVKILGEVEDWDLPDLGDDYQWYEPYMEFASNRNVIPEDDFAVMMTRADIAEMIYRNLQVVLLNVQAFVDSLVDELFYQYGVPLSGSLGPGGLLGPGGPFGNAGAFYGGDYFVEDDEFEILDDDFYTDSYCYFSSSGDFRDRVVEILADISGKDVTDIEEELELEGYDIDDFGTMFCYPEELEEPGDLVLFTDEMSEQFDVNCWPYEGGVGDDYQEVLCYVEPEEPEWLDTEPYCVYEEDLDGSYCETCYDGYYSGLILSQTCTDTKLVACCVPGLGGEEVCVKTNKQNCEGTGGRWLPGTTWCSPDPCNQQSDDDEDEDDDDEDDDEDDEDDDDSSDDEIVVYIDGVRDITASAGTSRVDLEFFVTDLNGNPLTDRALTLLAHSGYDYREYVAVEEAGEGVYLATFSSELAGNFILTLEDYASDYETMIPIAVKPSSLDHVEITDVVYPYESGEINKAYLQVVAKDRYDNILPYSSINNNLSAITTLGSVDVSYDSDGIFTVELTTDDWGVAEVTIVNASSAVSYGVSEEIFFFPVQLVMPKGIEEGTEQIQADVYVYLPEERGQLGSYDLNLVLAGSGLRFVDVEDPIPGDNFGTPFVEVGTNSLRLWQTSTLNDSDVSEIIHVGTALFEVISVGSGSIYVDDIVITDEEGEEKNYLERFTDWIYATAESVGTTIEEATSSLFEGFWRWWYNVKPIIDVCIDVFIFPGDGVTAADVNTDIITANAIFTALGANCNCNFYLNIVLNSITNLTDADWKAVDANGDGNLDEAEIDTPVNNHPATGDCVPIYYVPRIDGGDLGWSWEAPPTEGAAVDHSEDPDNRTLAHELAHQLSQGEVEDPGKPNAAAQGANDAGNLMNYNNTGDNLTPDQCALIEQYINP